MQSQAFVTERRPYTPMTRVPLVPENILRRHKVHFNIDTRGNFSVPGLGMRNSPASATGLPFSLPLKNCEVLSVSLCTTRISKRSWAWVAR
jgi:hypothetical protein